MGGEQASPTGPDLRFAGARLTIDLAALRANYAALAQICAPATTAAVVKADAYGLGISRVVPALAASGCTTFFVALADEGFAVRAAAPEATVFVLNGLFGPETAAGLADARLIPVLNSAFDLRTWETFCGKAGARHPCGIHVDTGMNRLGLSPAEALAFAEENALTRALAPVLVMSHLACADELQNPANRRQLESFQRVAAAFADIESSLASSAGILLGKDFHLAMTRPGIAVYGGAPLAGIRNPMRTVVTAEARVVQVRRVAAGEAIGYGASIRARRDTIAAVVAVGYADGYPRAGSGAGVPLRSTGTDAAHGFIGGRRVPVIGRITMDLTTFDVTELGDGAVSPGDYIELFGSNIPIDAAAAAAGTISYELLTGLGRRYRRDYVGLAG